MHVVVFDFLDFLVIIWLVTPGSGVNFITLRSWGICRFRFTINLRRPTILQSNPRNIKFNFWFNTEDCDTSRSIYTSKTANNAVLPMGFGEMDIIWEPSVSAHILTGDVSNAVARDTVSGGVLLKRAQFLLKKKQFVCQFYSSRIG